MSDYDLLVTNARVVRPDSAHTETLDIAVKDGRFAHVGAGLEPSTATRVVNAGGRLAFPGVVDVHQHWGIYNDLADDARTESRAAAQGGVTSGITYIRTGQYYLNRTGPYAELYPDVLTAAENQAYIDYGFHVAPILASTSRRSRSSSSGSGCPRSRSSCSTARTGCTGAPPSRAPS